MRDVVQGPSPVGELLWVRSGSCVPEVGPQPQPRECRLCGSRPCFQGTMCKRTFRISVTSRRVGFTFSTSQPTVIGLGSKWHFLYTHVHGLCFHRTKHARCHCLRLCRFRTVNVSVPKKTRNNGTLYAYVFLHHAGILPWNDGKQVHLVSPLTTYMVPKPEEVNLLTGGPAAQVSGAGGRRPAGPLQATRVCTCGHLC